MLRKAIVQPKIVQLILILQFIPLVLFPPESFSPTTQEWWLPVLLAIMAIIAVFQITVRHTVVLWPWYLLSFSQGFNIISRLMLLMPHATVNVGGVQQFNTPYVALTILSILLSSAMLSYLEMPEVRMTFLPQQQNQKTAST